VLFDNYLFEEFDAAFSVQLLSFSFGSAYDVIVINNFNVPD
jgi:hypothetical protein